MIIRRSKSSDMKTVCDMALLFCKELGYDHNDVIPNIQNGVTTVFVAEDETGIIGVLGGIKVGVSMLGDVFYVDGSRRGSRAAYKLLKEGLLFAKSINCETAHAIVKPERKRFYETAGYKQKMCVMEKTL